MEGSGVGGTLGLFTQGKQQIYTSNFNSHKMILAMWITVLFSLYENIMERDRIITLISRRPKDNHIKLQFSNAGFNSIEITKWRILGC